MNYNNFTLNNALSKKVIFFKKGGGGGGVTVKGFLKCLGAKTDLSGFELPKNKLKTNYVSA